MNDENNNENNEITYDVVRNRDKETKLEYVKKNITQSEIPSNFEAIANSNGDKIFFEEKDGQKIKREWILFQDNKFYCIYCLCFAVKENLWVKGIIYGKNCRITEKAKIHGNEKHHIFAKNIYSRESNCGIQEQISQSPKRNIIRAIIKIIIFLATHG